jgi:heme A synthase
LDKRKRGFLWIALGLVCLVVMVGAVVAGGLAYVVYQQFALKQTVVEPTDAAQALDRLRAQFHDPPRLQ